MPPIVTLLTDYGLADSYVAEVKAVLVRHAPGAVLVDVSHLVPPGDIRAAQYLLGRTWSRFPKGTVHVAVVDPGVGTSRRALAAQAADQFFVAPDNGLLSFLPGDARFVSLAVPASAAPTFHGRDVFAPAAAQLVNGTALAHLGLPVTDRVLAPLPAPRWDGVLWTGEVIYVDRFGTLVTNIPGDRVEPGVQIRVNGTDVGPLHRTFGEVGRGQVVAFIGSSGNVEVAVRDGSAARLLGVGVGAEVRA